jgi:hypothetical protein
MPADTLTLTLLDREVVLTRARDGQYYGGPVSLRRGCPGYDEPFVVTFHMCGVVAEGSGKTEDEAAAACDQKLRQLREWFNG